MINLITLFVYWLSVYAISYIFVEKEDFEIVRSKFLGYCTIFPPIIFKFFFKLLECIYCFSFWTGLAIGSFLYGWMTPLYALSCFGFVLLVRPPHR